MAPSSDDLLLVLRGIHHPLAAEALRAAQRVASHPLFSRLRTAADVRVLMEHHVWAVWDFMSLLKSVQAAIAPARVPWWPPADPEAARLINEMIVGEECDDGPLGRPSSHFEVYVHAMERAGANAGPIRQFISDLEVGLPWERALARAEPPPAARAFVETTLAVASGPLHGRVAALTLGREEIIPAMFRRIVRELGPGGPSSGGRADLGPLLWYLDRHIEVDGSRHGPMASRLFERVCARDAATLRVSLEIALRVLSRRHALWSAAEAAIDTRPAGRVALGAAPAFRL